MNVRKLLDWRKLLIYSHRWLGIAVGIVLVAWCVSGIVLMYYGVPTLSAGERLMRLPPLDLSSVTVTPSEAASLANGNPFRLRISMHGDRPVYRINTGRVFGRWTIVYADTGELIEPLDAQGAMEWLGGFVGQDSSNFEYEAYLEGPDLFTRLPALGTHMPMHRIALNDDAGTVYYVSENSGEAVVKADTIGRILGFSGYILHTFFWWRQQRWWGTLLDWLSWIGLAMVITGVVVGIWRVGLSARFRHKGIHSHSPYVGWMKWHHYAGLIFGLVAVTWMFSGLVSRAAIPTINETPYTRDQIAAGGRSVQGAGATVNFEPLTIAGMQGALSAIAESFVPSEIELLEFNGEPYFISYRPPTPDEADEWVVHSGMDFIAPALDWDHQIASALRPDDGTFTRFDEDAMLAAAERAMPGMDPLEAAWLDEFDDYYYDTVFSFDIGLMKTAKTLPVLQLKYDDPEETWLYMTPSHGQIVKADKFDRRNRWGYYGLHGMDFAFLYNNRPLWDIVTLALLVGATVLSVSTLVPMYRRLRRHTLRAWSTVTRRRRRRPVPAPQVTMSDVDSAN